MNGKLIAALVLFAVAVALGIRSFQSHERGVRGAEDFPEGTLWLCQDCRHEFSVSIEDLGVWYAKHPGKPHTCPSCEKSNTARAVRCRHEDCGRLYVDTVTIEDLPGCPVCERVLPKLHSG